MGCVDVGAGALYPAVAQSISEAVGGRRVPIRDWQTAQRAAAGRDRVDVPDGSL